MFRNMTEFLIQACGRRFLWVPAILSFLSFGGCGESAVDLSNMVYIPEGSALIGCRPWGAPDQEPCGDLEPLEEEKYFDAFWIDKHEVTNEEFARFLNTLDEKTARQYFVEDPPWDRGHNGIIQISFFDDGWTVLEGAKNLPALNVTWEGARAYCSAQGKRIPTADKWEKAARGTEGALFPWGDTYGPEDCVLYPEASEFRTYEVGTCDLDTSPFGVKDMGSNLMEWVEDESAYKTGWRVIKGDYVASGRYPMFVRYHGGPEVGPLSSTDTTWGNAVGFLVGFRCVVSLDENGQ